MNKSIIFRKIGGIISEITEQYQYLSGDPENINPLELELFVANSHFLSEHLAILKKLDASAESESSRSKFSLVEPLKPDLTPTPELLSEHGDHPESNVEEPAILNQANEIRGVQDGKKEERWFEPVSESKALFSSVGITEDIPQVLPKSDTPPTVSGSFVEAPPELPDPSHIEIQPEVHSEVINELRFEKLEEEKQPELAKDFEPVREADFQKQPDPVKLSEIAKEREAVKETFPVNDRIHHQEFVNNNSSPERVPTLNEILSASKHKENITSTIKMREERDLKSMINLNDKLMFIRDLFNGYSLAYSEAIDLVNRFDNFKSADNFLKQNYAEKNKWSEKQGSVDQFYEILNKRFN